MSPLRIAVQHLLEAVEDNLGARQLPLKEMQRRADAVKAALAQDRCGGANCMGWRVDGVTGWVTEAARDAAVADALAQVAAPVQYGCHCDLEEHMSPDGCVLDEGRPGDCIYTRRLLREGLGKTDCDWRPIQVKR